MRLPRLVAVSAASLALALSACGSQAASDPAGFNDADVEFASEMIQHHAQALVMVDMTLGRELDPAVVDLTEEIRAAQTPEIETMADWLEDWDQPVPETSRDHANAHGGHGDGPTTDVPGMMSAEDMVALEDASGEKFEDRWLEMMVEHHEGAVTMAETQLDEGQNGKASALAEDIITTQQREIETMQGLLED
jgi:uncharacterized protein (DUF305 family)